MKKYLLLLLTLITNVTLLFSQTSQGVNYQTIVRDGAGNVLVLQSVGTQFVLHQGTVTGTAVYTETWSTTTNTYGLLNFVIGNGTTTDDFSSINWSNGPYYLEVLLDISGGTNYLSIGTSQLMSVPYALHAKTAESTNAINGATNYLSKYTGTNTIGNSLIYDDGTNIGIGVTNLTERFSVYPNVDVASEIGKAHIGFMGHGNWAGFSHIDVNSPGSYALLQNNAGQTILNSASGQNILIRNNNSTQAIFQSDGDFGVGTPNPNSKVEVVGDVRLNGNNAGLIYQNKETNKDWRLIYVDGFEAGTEGWISNQPLSTGDAGLTRQSANVAGLVGHFIRPTNNNYTLKKFFNTSGLSYSEVKVEFNYLFLDTWDDEIGWLYVTSGEAGNPTPIWNKKHQHDESDLELNGTTYNVSFFGSGSASDLKSKGQAQFSWNGGGFWLQFGGNLDGVISDETFGIDNIMIYVR